MKWLLKNQGTRSPADLSGHIERRLRFALVRFSPRVERIVVFLQDRNGPKGGVDKVCRILARVKGCGVIVATIVDTDWAAAVDRAASRVGHTVARQLGRLHDRRGTATPRRPAVSLLRATRQPRPGPVGRRNVVRRPVRPQIGRMAPRINRAPDQS
jgi:hypothetical protein